MRIVLNFLLGLAAIGACWAAWWTVYEDAAAQAAAPGPAKGEECLAVEVLPVRKQTIADRIQTVGSLEPSARIRVRARVGGYICELPYDLGDRVEANTPVVVLDDTLQKESISQAEAALRVAEAELKSQEAVRDQARRHLKRIVELRAANAATDTQLDEAQSAVEVAEAQVVLERARVEQARSTLNRARLELADLKVSAPLPGIVSERLVEIGDLAQPNDVLMQIVTLDQVQCDVHVIEKDFERMKPGLETLVSVDGLPGKSFHGRVVRVAPTIDPATRTGIARVEIPNPRHSLRPGMHARLTILSQEPRSVDVVPVQAVVDQPDGHTVFVVQGTPPTVERRPVRIGFGDGLIYEVLSGLKAGEQVITLGSRLVHHGQQVDPVAMTWPTGGDAIAVHALSGDPASAEE